MQRAIASQTKLESSSAAFRHPRPEPHEPLPPYSINVLGSVQRHKLLVLLVTLATLILGFGYLQLKYGHSFYAEALVYVSPSYPQTLPQQLTNEKEIDRPYDAFVEQQAHTVTRHDVLVTALRRLPKNVYGGGSEQEIADRLAGNLEVERVGQTFSIKIGLHGSNPTHLAEIVNAVTRAYLEAAKGEDFYGRDSRLKGLRADADALSKDIEQKQGEQAAIERDLGIASISLLAVNPYNDRLARLGNDLVAAREARHLTESQLESVTGDGVENRSPALQAEAQELIAQDVGLNGLKQALNQRRGQLVADMAGMTEQNPARKQYELEIADIDTTLHKMTRDMTSEVAARLNQKYTTAVSRARSYEAQLSRQIAGEEAEAALATPKFQRAQSLNNEIDHDQQRLHIIEDRIDSLELESSSPGSVHLFSPAQKPLRGETGKQNTLLLILLPLAFAVGIAAAVVMDTSDKRVHSAEDVERTIGLPPVGVLFDRADVTEAVESEYAFRMGATLDNARRVAGVKTFAFAAVTGGGGTTTVVHLLAGEMAQLGSRVLVLDARGKEDAVAYIPPDADDPEGNPRARTLHPELGLLLHSRGRLLPSVHTITEAFKRSHGEYDALLLDCGPLMSTADTEYLARQADATLLIAESGVTTKPQLLRAARLLERLRVAGLAVILNRLPLDRADGSLRGDLREYDRDGIRPKHRNGIPAVIDAVDYNPHDDDAPIV